MDIIYSIFSYNLTDLVMSRYNGVSHSPVGSVEVEGTLFSVDVRVVVSAEEETVVVCCVLTALSAGMGLKRNAMLIQTPTEIVSPPKYLVNGS